MGMSFYRVPAIFMVAAVAAMQAPMAAFPAPVEICDARPVRRKKRASLDAIPGRHRRGKRAQAKPRKRSNRLIVSKRVRRKHRRAA